MGSLHPLSILKVNLLKIFSLLDDNRLFTTFTICIILLIKLQARLSFNFLQAVDRSLLMHPQCILDSRLFLLQRQRLWLHIGHIFDVTISATLLIWLIILFLLLIKHKDYIFFVDDLAADITLFLTQSQAPIGGNVATAKLSHFNESWSVARMERAASLCLTRANIRLESRDFPRETIRFDDQIWLLLLMNLLVLIILWAATVLVRLLDNLLYIILVVVLIVV